MNRGPALQRRWPAAAAIVWALVMTAGFAALWRYKTTPGAVAVEPPPRWPDDVAIARAAGKATIVMLAHPKCPCTRASLSELAVLMTRLGTTATAIVLFVAPAGVPDGWERSDTWGRASAISGVRVLVDPKGALAQRFGATVSGHTVVYDRDGRLVFHGGITAARGHEGDNAGRAMIVSALGAPEASSGDARPGATPTFGCGLSERTAERAEAE